MSRRRAGAPTLMMAPEVLRFRETSAAELALEHFLGRSFLELRQEAERTGACDEQDLLAMGWALYGKLVDLARGKVSAVSVERRLPRRGEYGTVQ